MSPSAHKHIHMYSLVALRTYTYIAVHIHVIIVHVHVLHVYGHSHLVLWEHCMGTLLQLDHSRMHTRTHTACVIYHMYANISMHAVHTTAPDVGLHLLNALFVLRPAEELKDTSQWLDFIHTYPIRVIKKSYIA